METAQRRQTISKLSRIPNYSGGGLIDGLKRVVGLAPKQPPAAPSKQPPAAPSKQPPTGKPVKISPGGVHPAMPAPMGNQTIIDKRMADAGLANGGKVKPGMAKAAMAGGIPTAGGKKKNDRGGMLKGPGTPTSDDIPAVVVDTGEPIKVATKERIVSDPQNQGLEREAKEQGFASLDAKLEDMTGIPVGPTLKYDNEMSRGAAAGASPEDLRRSQLVSQIPTGGVPGAGPTEQPDPSQSASGSDVSRNISNLVNAIGPLAGGARLMMAAGKAGSALGQSAMVGRAVELGAKAGPYAVPAVGAMGLSAAASNDQKQPLVSAQPTAVPPKAASVAAANAVPTPAAPAKVAAKPSAEARLGGLDGVNVGNGVTRFDAAGKAPLFTNMTDDQGMASNAALSARGSVSEQDQGAAAALAGNYQRQARAALANDQYNREVLGAKAVNEAGARMNLEYDAKNGNPQAARAALRLLTQANDGDITRRGQDITERGQQASERGQSARDKLAQADFDLRAKTSALDNEASARLLAAQSAMANAKTDAERQAAEQTFRALQGKYAKETPEQFAYAPGGQSIDPATGQLVTQPGVIFNKSTGEIKQPGQAKSIATDPRAIAIRDNKEMTREQKLAELKKMGYQ